MDEIRILVEVENRRKIVKVPSGDVKDLKAVVFAEFDGILLPEAKIIFQKWDDVFSVYVDLEEEGSPLKDKDKVQVLQELPINNRTSTPTAEQHWKTLQSPGTSSISSVESSKSTLSVDTDMSELSEEEAESQTPKQLNTLEKEPQEIPIPDGFPSSFKMPKHFGSKVDRALKSGVVDNKVRNAVVRTVATCVRAMVNRPTPYMCEYLAKKLIHTYPCLKEKDPREFLKQAGVKVAMDNKGKRPFKNWAMMKRQFQRKFENMKSGEADHDKEEEPSDSLQEEGDTESGPDDTISTERNINKLKNELTKSKWNAKTVQELLRATFTARRKAMLRIDARSRVTKTLREFRCLSHQVEFETELVKCMQETCAINLPMEEMMSSWTKLVDPLINMAQKRKILAAVDEDPGKKEIAALKCLRVLFKLKHSLVPDADKHFIVVVESGMSLEEAKEQSPSSSPFLMVTSTPEEQVFLMLNSQDEYMEIPCDDGLARAVVSLIGMYYVFHLEYPTPAKGAFIFLQEYLLHDFLAKRPSRYVTWLADLQLPSV